MSLTESRLYRETLAAAIAFHARKLWLEHGDDECFAMVVPGEEHPVFASIMGQAGREFGLVLFRGPTVGSDLMDVLGSDEPENAFQDDLTFLSFSMTRYEDVAPEGRSFLAKAGFAGRRQDIVPFFFAKEPGRVPRKLTRPEVKTYLYALKGTLKAKEAGLLAPMPFRPGEETLTLLLSGDPLDPEVTTECRRLGSSGAEETHVDEREDIVPAPDDLDGWKRCDQRLFRRAQGRLKETVDSPELALELYFGSRDAYRRFLNDPNDQFPSTCFFEWYWHDHRVASTGMSLAERMLSGALPQAERLLLEARLRAVPSLFKVERIEKGKSLTVLDVLFGGETVVYDKALSESATVNMSLAARVFPAGSFHLVSPLGPPLAPLELDGALGFLQHLGMKLAREGTKDKSHLFGRLWAWAEKHRAGGFHPRIQNTDGDEMRFHTATYAVNDEAQARAALSSREEIEQEKEGRYTWFRVNKPGSSSMPGDTTTLGTLSFVGDELLVEVNSARRLKKARAWLDGIPGIEFRSVRVRTLDEVREEGIPPDDRLGRREVPVTPELVAHIRDLMHRQYMQWLDMPLPMLGGTTPRETCRTAEGKKKIARLIRTIPKPMGPAGADVDIPRKQMFDALGLTDED